MNIEQGFLQKKHLSQQEAIDSVKELSDKADELAISLAEDDEAFQEYYDKVTKMAEEIGKKYPQPGDIAATYGLLTGGSIGPKGCEFVDFPEPEFSVRKFIDEEYNKRFASK